VAELYPYFAFLQAPNVGSMELFKQNFCAEGDPQSSDRLSVFLRTYMIRRTHQDKLFAAKLLDLPHAHETTIYVEFSNLERECYEILKKRFVEQINKSWDSKTKTERYKTVRMSLNLWNDMHR
jgi:SNF2 family DNA or RNA helicase